MASFPSAWPGLPGTVFYEEPVSIPTYILKNIPAVAVPPLLFNHVQKCRSTEARKFLLHKSVFELVSNHHVLHVTDPHLRQWYLTLSREDKKIIHDEGGLPQFLHRHPGLELFQDHASLMGTPHSQPLEMLSNNVRESFAPFVCLNNRSKPQQQMGEEICHNHPVVNRPTYYHPLNQSHPKINRSNISAAVDHFSQDIELERCSQIQNPELWNQNWMQKHCVAATYPGVSPSQTAWPALRLTPEEHHGGSMLSSQSLQLQKAYCQEEEVVSENITADKDEECKLGLNNQSDQLCTIMEMDKSILMCLPKKGPSTHDAAVQCCPVSINQHIQAPTSDAMVNTESVGFTSAHTQTEAPETAEQQVNTEVHMSDMDYFAKEFIRLSRECKKPKGKIKRTSQVPPLRHEAAEEAGCPADEGRKSHHIRQKETEHLKEEKDKTRTTAAVAPNTGGVDHSEKQEEQIPFKEVNVDKVWYDAEEYLQPVEPAEAAEVGQNPDKTDESVRDKSSCSELLVSYLPSDMTQHLSGAAGRGYSSAALGESTFSPKASGAQTSRSDSSSAEKKLLAEPHLSASIRRKTLVSFTPTAEGTFLPQHFGTMSSLDTLMAELTQLHPHVDRQRIMDALMELKAIHGRVMITLPLRTIRDMTSDLLTKPTSATLS